MSVQSLSCPECGAVVKASVAAGKTVRCPRCKNTFRARAEAPPAAGKKPAAADGKKPAAAGAIKKPGTGPAAKPRRREDALESPRKKQEEPEPSGKKKVVILLGLGAVLLIAGAVVMATGVLGGDDKKDKKQTVKAPDTPPSPPGGPGTDTPSGDSDKPGGDKPGGDKPGSDKPVGGTLPWAPDPVTEKPKPKQEAEDSGPPPPEPEIANDKNRPFLVFDAEGHTGLPRAVLFTNDGKQAVSIADDKTVRVWDVASGRPVRVLRLPAGTGDEGVPYAAALAPSGKRLAVGGVPYGRGDHGALIHIIALDTGKVEQVLTGHENVINGLAFSKDGTTLASCSEDRTARVYDLQTGKATDKLPHKDAVKAVAWAPDNVRLVTACSDKLARIWNFQTRTAVELKGHAGPVTCLAVSRGGLIASGGIDGTIRLWGANGSLTQTIRETEDDGQTPVPITSLTFNRDGRELLYTGGSPTGKVALLSTSNGRKRIQFKKHTNAVMSGALSPDGTLGLTSGGNDHESFLWKTSDGSVVHTLKSGGRSVWGVGWSPEGRTIAWGNTNKGDTTEGTTPLEQTFRLDALDFGPAPKADFRRARLTIGDVALGALDAYQVAVRIKGQTKYTLTSPIKEDRVYCFTLLPRDRAVLGTASGLYLYDLNEKDPMTGREVVRRFNGHTGAVLSMAVSPGSRYLVTGSNDQTICVWHPGRSEPILSLFLAGRDWVAWTPEGHYGASAKGESLMGWLSNNGPDKLATYNPAAFFHQSLFNPGALRALWKSGGHLKRALAAASTGGDTVTLNVGKVLPPEVVIRSPTAAAQFGDKRVQVKAVATSKGDFPVTSIRLLVDGRPYRGSKGVIRMSAPKLGPVEADWTVEVTPGKHSLVVHAESKVSKGMSPVIEVTRTGEPEIPNLYILACGVSAYPGPLRLRYAASDAELITKAFKEKTAGVFGKVEVRKYLDGQGTRKGIEEGLAWLETVMTPKDVGLFFFSGHGAKDEGGEFYLVPIDAGKDLSETAVTGNYVQDALAKMSGRLICMLDCCHSGAVASENSNPLGTDDLVRKLTGDDCGVVCMCASTSQEVSIESTETKAGFFTRSVVDGLAGAADLDRDKVIYIHELDTYVKQQVYDLSGGRQNPTTGRPPALRSFPLAKP
ncbi:MAG TPA: caspase family protein [Gemmataceae bacterium]|nr:caspase family protein [Gemmataceae bacterium]